MSEDTKVITKISMAAMRDEYEKIANPIKPAISLAKHMYRGAKNFGAGMKQGYKGGSPNTVTKNVTVNKTLGRPTPPRQIRPGDTVPNTVFKGHRLGKALKAARGSFRTSAPAGVAALSTGFGAGRLASKRSTKPATQASKAPPVPNRADFINRQ